MPGSTLSTTTVVGAISSSAAHDTAADATALSLKASAGTVECVSINNSNGAAKSYTELWDALVGSVNVGTTVPNMWFPCDAGRSQTYWLRNLVTDAGIAFATGITIASVTAPGGLTSPSGNKPIITVLFT